MPDALSEIQLPPGAVIVREFKVTPWNTSGRADKSEPDSKRIETRLLVTGAPRGYGASYRWKTAELAELVEDGRLETLADLMDASSIEAKPKKVSLRWWFPGLDDVTVPIRNPSYWISTANEDFIVSSSDNGMDRTVNWLRTMWQAGVLESPLSLQVFDAMPSGSLWQNRKESLEVQVRFYLHGNCAVCHQPGGASRGLFDARLTTPLGQAGIVRGELAAGDLGIAGAKVVVPGSPEKSILYQRLKRTDFFRMPPVQFHDEPSPILPVLEEWIRGLGPTASR